MNKEEIIAALKEGWKGVSGLLINPNTCKELLSLLENERQEGYNEGHQDGTREGTIQGYLESQAFGRDNQ